jgi:N-acetylglucosaminyl-diphospho-decaprenol L-rhamnosyltransferase
VSDAVSAVILNWRTPEHTLRARDALIADGLPAERVLIVDNASGDGSLAAFAARAGSSPALALPENVGFARANNAGAHRLPAARAYLFVNGDAFVHRAGSVAALVAALARPGVGIAVPRLRNPDLTLQPSVVPQSAPLPELVRASGLSRLVPNRWQPSLGTHWDHGGSRVIQSAIGPVLAVAAGAWDAVGGFDERIFMYGEDHDLFRRIRSAGYEARFVAEAEFIHLGGASSAQRWGDAERAERVARAEATTLVARLPAGRAQVTIGLMAGGVGIRSLVLRLGGRREAGAVQAGWFRGYRSALRARSPARARRASPR